MLESPDLSTATSTKTKNNTIDNCRKKLTSTLYDLDD